MNYKKRLRRDRKIIDNRALLDYISNYHPSFLLKSKIFTSKSENGYYKCFLCNGIGFIYVTKIATNSRRMREINIRAPLKKLYRGISDCRYCFGRGGFDWIENITKGNLINLRMSPMSPPMGFVFDPQVFTFNKGRWKWRQI